jgi:ABC-2 type transport system permease protein
MGPAAITGPALRAAPPTDVHGRRAPAPAGVTFPRVLAAEWTKLVSLRSTPGTVLGTVAAAAALALALGLFVRPEDGRSAVSLVVGGAVLAQLGALVLGVQVGAGEYATGASTTTFTAVPRRLPVLGAQALVTAAVALATALLTLAASTLVTHAPRGSLVPLPGASGDDGTARVLVGFAVQVVCVALLGVGLGALLRGPTAALVAGVLLLLVVDQVLAANPGQVADTVRALLPGAGARLVLDDAGLAAVDATSQGPRLGWWGAGAVLGGWVAALLAASAYRLRRHDVR